MRRGYQVCWRRLHQGPSHLYDFVYSVYTKYILYIYFYIIIFSLNRGHSNRQSICTCYMRIHPCIPPGRYTPKAYQVWSIELNLRATFTTKTPLSRHAGDGTIGRSSCLSGGYSEKNPASVVQFRENLGRNHTNGLSMFCFFELLFLWKLASEDQP